MTDSKSSLLYRSGDAFLNKNTTRFLATYLIGNDDTLYYVNIWSFVHMLAGFMFYYVFGNKPIRAMLAHLPWEFWQLFIGMTPMTLRGLIDSINDTVFFMAGFYIQLFSSTF